MRDGFIKAAAVTPKVKVADVAFNKEQILLEMKRAAEEGAAVIVFPELCITGYSCRDLFLQESLLREAVLALLEIAEQTKDINAVVFVGLPYVHNGKLYNVAAALCRGQILGLVPKTYLPNYQEFYEARQFTPGMRVPEQTVIAPGVETWIGTAQLFSCPQAAGLVIGVEICEDLWAPDPPRNGPLPAGGQCAGQPLRQRRGNRQAGLPAPAGGRPVRPAATAAMFTPAPGRASPLRMWCIPGTT